jgi:ABC-type ATPase involved in cell division
MNFIQVREDLALLKQQQVRDNLALKLKLERRSSFEIKTTTDERRSSIEINHSAQKDWPI